MTEGKFSPDMSDMFYASLLVSFCETKLPMYTTKFFGNQNVRWGQVLETDLFFHNTSQVWQLGSVSYHDISVVCCYTLAIRYISYHSIYLHDTSNDTFLLKFRIFLVIKIY